MRYFTSQENWFLSIVNILPLFQLLSYFTFGPFQVREQDVVYVLAWISSEGREVAWKWFKVCGYLATKCKILINKSVFGHPQNCELGCLE